jgi:2-polyprenyl-3-methyl-5-hydroxy-6-metoxy-1,4-benzoquinol methylase
MTAFPEFNRPAKVLRAIPRFVEAYDGHFGLQWNTFPRTQLDSYTGTTISHDRLKRCLGAVWDDLIGKQVLECGCGAGRFTEVLLRRGASVTALDLSEAIDSARNNCERLGSVRFAQASILELPFAPQQFDLVLCIGVLQHTPSPEESIAKLWDQVKPGGHLIIDHYSFSKLRYFLTATPYLRFVLNHMNKEQALRCTNRLVKIAFPLQKALRGQRVLSRLVSRVLPINSYFRDFPELNDTLQFELSLLDTHDTMTDGYKHSRNVDEIRRVLTDLGGTAVEAWRGGNGVEARAMRPGELQD